MQPTSPLRPFVAFFGVCLALFLALAAVLPREGTAQPLAGRALPASDATPVASLGCADILLGGGFEEEGAPAWEQFSTNFGTPHCGTNCGNDGMTAGPRTGKRWMWFGGAGTEGTISPEIGIITQTVTLQPGSATLSFYLWLGRAGEPEDNFEVLMNGTQQFVVFADSPEYSTYQPVSLDLSAFADGDSHALTFRAIQTVVGANFVTNFNLDDASLISCPLTTPTATATPTLTPSSTPTTTPTLKPSSTATATATLPASATATASPSPSATGVPSATPTATGTPTIPPASFRLHLPLIER